MALAVETDRRIFSDKPRIIQIGNGKDLYNSHPTSRSRSQKWADECFIDVSSRPVFPARVLTGPRAIDRLGESLLGSMVRGDAMGFEVKGNKRILREIYEFGLTGVELRRKSDGMIPFVEAVKEGNYLRELFKMLEISGEPVVGETSGISLTFIRQYAPIDTVYEYSPFARVSVQTLGGK